MQAFVAGITAFALVIQGLFGCCVGAALAAAKDSTACASCSPGEICETVADSQAPTGDHCQPTTADDHSQLPSPPCKPQCKGVCTYVGPQKASIDYTPVHLAYTVVSATVAVSPAQTSHSNTVAISFPCEPPLRLHLLNQTLLI